MENKISNKINWKEYTRRKKQITLTLNEDLLLDIDLLLFYLNNNKTPINKSNLIEAALENSLGDKDFNPLTDPEEYIKYKDMMENKKEGVKQKD